jgi:hypothetical protein
MLLGYYVCQQYDIWSTLDGSRCDALALILRAGDTPSYIGYHHANPGIRASLYTTGIQVCSYRLISALVTSFNECVKVLTSQCFEGLSVGDKPAKSVRA